MGGRDATNDVWRPESQSGRARSSGPAPTFAIVVPTAGRGTLPRTLASIARQIEPGDEIIVECSNDDDWGNSARQRGVEAASASHILFCDDDDVFLPGAFAVLREFAAEYPEAIGIFRRRFNAGPPEWREPVLRPGNVQCMGFVIPNKKGKLGVWGRQSRDPARQAEFEAGGVKPWSDADFIRDTAALQGASVIFGDVIVGHARPEESPIRRLRYRLKLRSRLRWLLSREQPPGEGWHAEFLPPRPS